MGCCLGAPALSLYQPVYTKGKGDRKGKSARKKKRDAPYPTSSAATATTVEEKDEKDATFHPQPILCRNLNYTSMLGPQSCQYYEIEEVATGDRRHLWLFGEAHSGSECQIDMDNRDEFALFSEWLDEIVAWNREFEPTLDIFLETERIWSVEEAKEMQNTHTVYHGLLHTVRTYANCLEPSRGKCTRYADTARFHAVDVRSDDKVSYVNIYSDAVQDQIRDFLITNDDSSLDARTKSFAHHIRDTNSNFLLETYATNDRAAARLDHERLHMAHNPSMSKAIFHFFRLRRREIIREMNTRRRKLAYLHQVHTQYPDRVPKDSFHRQATHLVDLVSDWLVLIMDEYCMYRANGRFPKETRSRFKRVTNAMLFTGDKHCDNYAALYKYLAEKNHIRILTEYHWATTAHATRCVFLPREMFQLLVTRPAAVAKLPRHVWTPPLYPFRREFVTLVDAVAVGVVCKTRYESYSPRDEAWFNPMYPAETHVIWILQVEENASLVAYDTSDPYLSDVATFIRDPVHKESIVVTTRPIHTVWSAMHIESGDKHIMVTTHYLQSKFDFHVNVEDYENQVGRTPNVVGIRMSSDMLYGI